MEGIKSTIRYLMIVLGAVILAVAAMNIIMLSLIFGYYALGTYVFDFVNMTFDEYADWAYLARYNHSVVYASGLFTGFITIEFRNFLDRKLKFWKPKTS